MAQNNPKVLLGFEDELIAEKYKCQTNITTNKIGGKPDLPSQIKLEPPICPLCQLPRPLVLQIYAPLENSSFHRTLYLFACINPNCWNHSQSWICIRIQSHEAISDPVEVASAVLTKSTDWCTDADEWGDDDNNANFNEENGNLINVEKISDDDESCSFEDAAWAGLGHLTLDDRNANNGASGGAVGKLHSPSATAEIEADEGEVVTIDSPLVPQRDLVALLQEATPLPQELSHNLNSERKSSLLEFVPFFISVWEEAPNLLNDSHVKELLQEYQATGEGLNLNPSGDIAQNNAGDCEKYEKSNPAHGDKMFHNFLSKIQMNPGQILRYSREAESVLLLRPLQEQPKRCDYCKGEAVFEFQLLPTIISKLKLISDPRNSRLEFGTVLVYTCRRSCWSSDSGPKYETVIVQSEI